MWSDRLTPHAPPHPTSAEHFSANALFMGSAWVRFCQQCGKFEALVEFEGERRSCRRSLVRHASYRRKADRMRRSRQGTQGTSATVAGVSADCDDSNTAVEGPGEGQHKRRRLAMQLSHAQRKRKQAEQQASSQLAAEQAAALLQAQLLQLQQNEGGAAAAEHMTPHQTMLAQLASHQQMRLVVPQGVGVQPQVLQLMAPLPLASQAQPAAVGGQMFALGGQPLGLPDRAGQQLTVPPSGQTLSHAGHQLSLAERPLPTLGQFGAAPAESRLLYWATELPVSCLEQVPQAVVALPATSQTWQQQEEQAWHAELPAGPLHGADQRQHSVGSQGQQPGCSQQGSGAGWAAARVQPVQPRGTGSAGGHPVASQPPAQPAADSSSQATPCQPSAGAASPRLQAPLQAAADVATQSSSLDSPPWHATAGCSQPVASLVSPAQLTGPQMHSLIGSPVWTLPSSGGFSCLSPVSASWGPCTWDRSEECQAVCARTHTLTACAWYSWTAHGTGFDQCMGLSQPPAPCLQMPGMPFGGFSEQEVAEITRELGIDLPPSPQPGSPAAGRPERTQIFPASPAQLQQVQQAPLSLLVQQQQARQELPSWVQAEWQCQVAKGGQQVLQLAKHVQNGQVLVQLANPAPAGQGLLQLAAAMPSSRPVLQLVGTLPDNHAVLQLASPVVGTGQLLQLATGGQQVLQLGGRSHGAAQLLQLAPVGGGAGSLQPAMGASVVQHSRLQAVQPMTYLLINPSMNQTPPHAVPP